MQHASLVEYEWAAGQAQFVHQQANNGALVFSTRAEPSKPSHEGWQDAREKILSARPRAEMIRDSMFSQLADAGRAPRAATDTPAS